MLVVIISVLIEAEYRLQAADLKHWQLYFSSSQQKVSVSWELFYFFPLTVSANLFLFLSFHFWGMKSCDVFEAFHWPHWSVISSLQFFITVSYAREGLPA